jgi:predicted ribosome quality control (RQC) complex YloA/Tae2 family protein
MNVDALTLAAIAGELEAQLIGARIEDVIQPTPHAVALQCWGGGRKGWLLASAHPQFARVVLGDEKPRKLAAEPPAFVMLLRKHLEGARVVAIRQPYWERMLEIGFARGSAASPHAAPVWLIVEIMGRLSNLILRDDAGSILGALRMVGAEVNRYRTIAPHVAYRSPPPQTRMLGPIELARLDPDELSADELRMAAQEPRRGERGGGSRKERTVTVAGLLAGQVFGFGRDLGEEVAVRALGAPDAPLAEALDWEAIAREARALAALMHTHAWQPTVVYTDASAVQPSAFAVYVPARFAEAGLRPAATVNAMLATYYEGAEWRGAVDSAKAVLRRLLTTQRERTIRKDEALREELRAQEEANRLRLEADILLAFQAEVPPRAASFTMENPFPDEGELQGASVTLALDPRLSAVENANRRYDRYHKLQRAAAVIPAQIEANAVERARIEQLEVDLALAETPAEIALVRSEVAEAGYLRGRKKTDTRQPRGGRGGARRPGKAAQPARRMPEGGTPLRLQSGDGFTVLVGKNSRQNEEVTFHEATGSDTWLHARGVPGAHVIVKSGGRPIPELTLQEAAALAAYYSQARSAGSVPVDHTLQRYVRHLKGGGPGMVTYERERTIHVAPADARQG